MQSTIPNRGFATVPPQISSDQSAVHGGRASKAMKRVARLVFCAGIVLIFARLHFAIESPVQRWDFQQFYVAAQMLRHGDAASLYNFSTQAAYQTQYVDPSRHVPIADWPYLYPPAVALMFLPMAWLPAGPAYVLGTAANLAFLLVALRIFQRELGVDVGDWPLFAALLFIPVMTCLLHGQLSLLILLLYTLAFVQLQRGHHLLAGVLVGLGAIKFQLVLGFVLVMLLRRAWRFVMGAGIGGGIVFAASVAVVGIRQMIAYPAFIQSVAYHPRVGMPWKMINLRGLFYFVLHREPSPLLVLIPSLALLLFVAYRCRDLKVAFICGMVASTVTAYHAYPQELSLLIPALLLVATRIRMSDWAAIGAMFAANVLSFEVIAWDLHNLWPLAAIALLVFLARTGGGRSAPVADLGAAAGTQ